MSHTLLLADDSETTHRVVALMFAERGVRVVSVMNGQQAVERLSAEPPDIVLAAVTLPKVDGYQLADFMQGQPQLRNVPILLLSGAFDAVDEERVRQSGASGVLVKPFESELVINRVKELLGFGGKPDRSVTPPGGRLFATDAPPHRPSLTGPRGAGAPAPRPDFPAPRQDPSPSARHDTGPGFGGASSPATPHEPPVYPRHDAPPNYAVPPPPSYGSAPGEAPHQPAWDRLREQTGLGPDTAHVESGNAGGADDYFDRLDAAFDNLDAQLSGRSVSRPRDAAPTTRRMPTPDDISTRRLPPVHPDAHHPEGRRADIESPYEDAGWFDGQAAPTSARSQDSSGYRAPASARHEPPPSYGGAPPPAARPETPPSYGEAPLEPLAPLAVARPERPASYGVTSPAHLTPPPPPANHAPPVYAPPVYAPPPPAPATYAPAVRSEPVAPAAPSFADAFDHMLAAEQGEAHPQADAHAHGPLIEISEEVIERIALRVAERLSEGVLMDTVTHIVSAVSERLVREEIARIRAAAQVKKP